MLYETTVELSGSKRMQKCDGKNRSKFSLNQSCGKNQYIKCSPKTKTIFIFVFFFSSDVFNLFTHPQKTKKSTNFDHKHFTKTRSNEEEKVQT